MSSGYVITDRLDTIIEDLVILTNDNNTRLVNLTEENNKRFEEVKKKVDSLSTLISTNDKKILENQEKIIANQETIITNQEKAKDYTYKVYVTNWQQQL